LDQFLDGTTDAFGGPGANNNDARRSRPDVIMLVGWALTVVALLGVGAIAIAPMHLVDSKRPVTAMPASLPGIAVEAAEDAKPSAAPPTIPVAVAPPPSIYEQVIDAAAARTQMAAWWMASHAKPHMPRHRRDMPTPMPTPRNFGCPASLGAACAAQQ
jgi:hypothetical protein